MLADFGFTPVQGANILSIGIPVACLIVTPLAGALARRIPRRRLFFVLYALQLPLLVSMTLPAQALQFARWLPPTQIIALSLAYTLMMPVLLALLMDKSERQTAALDSSLQFSVILVGSYAAGFTALRMAQNWGYASVYQTAVLLALATGAMLWRYRQWTPQNDPAA
jgi:MFS_1, major facilitator family